MARSVRKQTAAKPAPLSITVLAQEIADLYDLAGKMEEASKMDGDGMSDSSRAADIEEAARERASALESVLFGQQPTSQSEALSLAMVLDTEFDTFLANHCEGDCAERAAKPLRRALEAIIRALHREAGASPLQGPYFSRSCEPLPWQRH